MYESCEIFIHNGYKLEIWNVESENDADTEFEKLKRYTYSECDDEKWENCHFINEIYYPINNNKKSYVNNCMTSLYALVNYDENTKFNFVVDDSKNIAFNISDIESNITITPLLEMMDKIKKMGELYKNDIFKNLIEIKNKIKYDRNNSEMHKNFLDEIKKINNSFHLHLSKLSKFLHDISEFNPNNNHEDYIKTLTKENLLSTISFIKNKKGELFNSRNTSELYTTTSIRHASTYKSLVSLRDRKNESKDISCNNTQQDNIMCKICMFNVSNMCNMHCGHIVTCNGHECLSYMEDINHCIVCRNDTSQITGLMEILLDENLYKCMLCDKNSEYLFDCGHVGFCDNCVAKSELKIFDCHRCKKKVKILCKIFI